MFRVSLCTDHLHLHTHTRAHTRTYTQIKHNQIIDSNVTLHNQASKLSYSMYLSKQNGTYRITPNSSFINCISDRIEKGEIRNKKQNTRFLFFKKGRFGTKNRRTKKQNCKVVRAILAIKE